MPHFGLIDKLDFRPEDENLVRARLHLRSARRRLRQGKTPIGLSTLFDAFLAAIRWYVASPERRSGLDVLEGDDMADESSVYELLIRSGVLDGRPDFKSFSNVVEDALDQRISNFDYSTTLSEVETVMTRLGVMPFDEDDLPPESPDVP